MSSEDFETHFGGTGFSDFFEQLFGSRMRGGANGFGGRGGNVSPEDFAEPSRDIEGDIMVTLEEAKRGSLRTVTIRHQNHTDSHQVKIPAGITEGQKLRISGRGEHGGDLYLRVRLARHPDFEVDGHNLIHELELAPWEAALGAEISVPTLDGKVNIKIPTGTASGQKLRVRGRGPRQRRRFVRRHKNCCPRQKCLTPKRNCGSNSPKNPNSTRAIEHGGIPAGCCKHFTEYKSGSPPKPLRRLSC